MVRLHPTATFTATQFPSWTERAACREKVSVPGQAWDAAFADDVSYRPSGEYRWPASVETVMRTCATCPVRAECLRFGFDAEDPIYLGETPTEDGWEPVYLVPLEAGVYGGVPGPQRERFRDRPDRLAAATAWFENWMNERRIVTTVQEGEEVA